MMMMTIAERLLAIEQRVEELERQELPIRNYSVPMLSIRPASATIGTRSFEIRDHNNSQDDLYVAVAASGVEGYIRSSGWLTASDERIKTDICALQRGLADIMNIHPITYSYRGEQKRRHGVTAQALQQVCPELVETLPDGTLVVRSTELIFILIRAVHELAEQVAALHAAVAVPPPPSDDPPHTASPLDPAE